MKKLLLAAILVIFSCRSGNSQGLRARYISLAPSTTEILFALGLDAEIVGVSSFCDFPPQAKSKEKVGTFSQPNMELILKYKPDYIFCTGLEQAPVVGQLRQLNLKVYTAHPSNMEELLASIIDIGKITGKEKEAEALVEDMRRQIKQITTHTASLGAIPKPKVFLEIWDEPLTTVGKGSFLDDLLTLAGGDNIASDTNKAFSVFSPEEVIRRNPDCIIIAYMNKQDPLKALSGRFGWQEIAAVKNNRIYSDIDPDLLLRPGPRVVIGIKLLHQRLYP